MTPYPKIQTLFKRDPETFKVIEGEFKLPEFEYLKDCPWQVTEKIDGTNIRVIWDGENVEFRGRTDRAQLPPDLLKRLQELFPPEKFKELSPMCLYGEGYGKKIQKVGTKYLIDRVDFILFDILCDGWWLKPEDMRDIAYNLGVRVVPDITNFLPDNQFTLKEVVEYVKGGFTSFIGTCQMEGVIIRPQVQLFNRQGHRIIGKLKHKDFA